MKYVTKVTVASGVVYFSTYSYPAASDAAEALRLVLDHLPEEAKGAVRNIEIEVRS